MKIKVLLANPRGFCAGVDRAIAIVRKTLDKYGPPIYVKNEVVHNKFVVNDLKQKGVIFVNELTSVPKNSVIIFSAHGVSQKIKNQAKMITNNIYDATCPLVTKVHKEVIRKTKIGNQVILIGHKKHPEVEGTLGQAKNVILIENTKDIDLLNITNNNISYTTQTTLSVDDTKTITDALKRKYPNISAPLKSDICYATQNRQDAVKSIMAKSEILLVLGSRNSSNSNRLQEIAIKMGKKSYLIDSADEINEDWLKNVSTIGITAGASAPEILVKQVLDKINPHEVIEILGKQEKVSFAIPHELR